MALRSMFIVVTAYVVYLLKQHRFSSNTQQLFVIAISALLRVMVEQITRPRLAGVQ